MKINWKRIIAREGLILLGCLVLTGGLLFVSTRIPQEDPTYIYRCSTGGHIYEVEMNGYFWPVSDSDSYNMFETVKKLYPNDFSGGIYLKVKDAYPLDFKVENVKTKYTFSERIRNVFNFLGVFILFLYPIYLIIRFVFWAIRTLRQ